MTVIAGNVKFDEVKRLAEKYIEPISAQPEPPKVMIVEPPQTGERRVWVQKDVSSSSLMIAYKVPESKNEDYYALSILSDILSSGNSSRLYSSLIDIKQLASQVFTNFGESFDPTMFGIYATAANKVNENDVEKAIYEEIEKIKTEGITEKNYRKSKIRN